MTRLKPWQHLKVEHNYTGSTWYDFTLDLVSAQVNLREFTGKHTAVLTFFNADMSPSQSDGDQVIRKGDKVRIFAKNASGTWRKMATFRVAKDGVKVAIDLTKPAGRQHRVTVSLEGVGITGVGGSAGGSGVASLHELSNTIEGAAFEINGEGDGSGITAADDDYTEISDNDAATEFDQIVLTRDSNPGTLVYEDPEGVLQIFNSATHQTAAATLAVGPENYSAIEETFDTSHIVNVLKLKKIKKVKDGKKGSTVIVLSEKFKDDDSIAKYGKRRKVLTIHGRDDYADYAAAVFAKNADPDPVPTSVTIPIRQASDLLGGYEDGVYVTKKVTLEDPNGTTYACRIKRIQHNITSKLWTVQLFLRGQDIMQAPREEKSSALGGTASPEVANNPDGSIEKEKLAFKIPENKVDTFTATAGGDQEFSLTYQPRIDSCHMRWNGQSQPAAAFDIDTWVATVDDTEGVAAAGDEFEFQYEYDDDTLRPPIPAAITLVGSGHAISGPTIALPAGTAAGDLIVLAIVAHAITPADCPDARMTVHQAGIVNPGSPTISTYLGYGIADSSGTALPITVPSAARVEIAVFRVAGDLDHTFTAIASTSAPFAPSVPAGDMGIAALVGVCKTVPNPFGADTTGDWATVSPGLDSDGTTDASSLIAYNVTNANAGSWTGLDGGPPKWAALVISLTDRVF